VQDDGEQRAVDLGLAVVLDEAELSELVQEEIHAGRVVPIMFARVSCEILGTTRWV
jgi:hypothetical protein